MSTIERMEQTEQLCRDVEILAQHQLPAGAPMTFQTHRGRPHASKISAPSSSAAAAPALAQNEENRGFDGVANVEEPGSHP